MSSDLDPATAAPAEPAASPETAEASAAVPAEAAPATEVVTTSEGGGEAPVMGAEGYGQPFDPAAFMSPEIQGALNFITSLMASLGVMPEQGPSNEVAGPAPTPNAAGPAQQTQIG